MKITGTLFFVLWCAVLFGQPQFYGVSDYKGGSLFKFDAAAARLSIAYRHRLHEVFPAGTLLLAPDGLLYGATKNGAAEGTGAIFSYNAASRQYTALYQFAPQNGSQPTGEMTWGKEGKMYGLTTYGGATNNGVLFSFDPATKTFEKLYDFDGASGANPVGALYVHTDGRLYGVTQLGGASGQGVLFSYDPGQHVYKKHTDFDPAKGAYPSTGLTKGADGKLYGATAVGGPKEWLSGSIYRFDPQKGTLTHLYHFNWETDDGYGVVSGLTPMPDGKLYGVGQSGGTHYAGVIFSFDPAKKAYAKLFDFSEALGSTPAGRLVAGKDGRLYGTTHEGNSYGYGGVFAFDVAARKFQNLHALQYTEGIGPAGAVCLGADGLLYALASFGGSPEYGTLFSIHPETGVFAKLKEWDEAPEGAYPQAAPVLHANGWFYGSTVGGGHLGRGVIYAFDPATKKHKTVYRFGAANGQYMSGGFSSGSDGRLFGLLNGGGRAGAGQLFSFDPQTNSLQTLYDFEQATGANPDGGLTEGDDGNYYGVASGGGQNGYGVVFSFRPASGLYTPVFYFDGAAGSLPMDGFAKAADGRLYGVAQLGGRWNKGVLYVFDPAAGKATALFAFSGADGAYPLRGLVVGTNGKLWGTTPSGGAQDEGVLFSYDVKSGAYAVAYHFNGKDGANPQGRLALGADGRLYGVARRGGAKNNGVVFSFNPQTGTYTRLKDFNNSGTSSPSGSALSEYCAEPKTFYRDKDGDGYGNKAQTIVACAAPAGYVATATDCNDLDKAIRPGATEICGNGIDDDCNAQTDETCTQTPALLLKNLVVTEAQGEAVVEINITQPVAKSVTVHYATVSGTALAGWDFGATAGLLKLEAGSTKAVIKIKIRQDKLKESDEQFSLFFWKPKELFLKKNAAVITIKDSNRAFGGGTIAAAEKTQNALSETAGLRVTAYPNPALQQFTLLPASATAEAITAVVLDASGKVAARLRGLAPNKPFVLGRGFAPGFYLVQLTQGMHTAQVKLVKQ